VRNAIEHVADIEVVGEAENGTTAVAKARELMPDLVLMDIDMPNSDGLEATSVIKRELANVKVIMLTVYDQNEHLFEAIKRGAEGFLNKNTRAHEILASVRGVMRGGAALSSQMGMRVLGEFARMASNGVADAAASLTPREKQVLRGLAKGLSNKEIAQNLVITENTVKAHVTNILRKLRLENRFQAAKYAIDNI
jgi:DNA-binding NarL/FixJ family response regulator